MDCDNMGVWSQDPTTQCPRVGKFKRDLSTVSMVSTLWICVSLLNTPKSLGNFLGCILTERTDLGAEKSEGSF